MIWMLCLVRLSVFAAGVSRSGWPGAWSAQWFDLGVGVVGVAGLVWTLSAPMFGPAAVQRVKAWWVAEAYVYYLYAFLWLFFATSWLGDGERWVFWLHIAAAAGCVAYALVETVRRIRSYPAR